MATFGYGLVGPNEPTIEEQMLEIERSGYEIDCWYADAVGKPTRAPHRRQFNKLLDHIQKSDALVVSKLDRLGRDAAQMLANIQALATLGVKVFVLRFEPLDLASPAASLMLLMLGAVADMESDRLAAKVQANHAKGGRKPGRPSATSQEQRAAMAAARRRGESLSALAGRYAVSRSTVLAATAELMTKEV